MLLFQNSGNLDIMALTVMGINAKESENSIGFFGTGLKYAAAIAVREGWTMAINTGDGQWTDITTKEELFRNKSFDVLYFGDTRLPFTAKLGKTWQPWMVLRELYSNALDENGEVYEVSTRPDAEENRVQIVLDGVGVETIWRQASAFIITSRERPQFTLAACGMKFDFYPITESARDYPWLFANKIAVHQMNSSVKMSYRISICGKVNLTEDRFLREPYTTCTSLVKAVMASSKTELWELFFAGEEQSEHAERAITGYSYPSAISPADTWSPAFLSWCKEQRYKKNGLWSTLKNRLRDLAPAPTPEPIIPTEMQQKMLQDCLAIMRSQGMTFLPTTTIELVDEPDYLGCFFPEVDKVCISIQAFASGRTKLLGTLLEEYFHTLGIDDYSRAFQDTVLDRYAALLLETAPAAPSGKRK